MAKTNDVRECLSCGGVFDTVLSDGTEYFHACPPYKRLDGAGNPVAIAKPRDENPKETGRQIDTVAGTDKAVVSVKAAGGGTKAGVRPASTLP